MIGHKKTCVYINITVPCKFYQHTSLTCESIDATKQPEMCYFQKLVVQKQKSFSRKEDRTKCYTSRPSYSRWSPVIYGGWMTLVELAQQISCFRRHALIVVGQVVHRISSPLLLSSYQSQDVESLSSCKRDWMPEHLLWRGKWTNPPSLPLYSHVSTASFYSLVKPIPSMGGWKAAIHAMASKAQISPSKLATLPTFGTCITKKLTWNFTYRLDEFHETWTYLVLNTQFN